MPYLFKPPTRERTIETEQGMFSLWRYFNILEGYSVLVTGATVSAYPGIRGPSGDQIEAADYAYIGGHEYTISDAEQATLVSADARWGNHCEAL